MIESESMKLKRLMRQILRKDSGKYIDFHLLDVGQALKAIFSKKLYKLVSSSWAAFCQDRIKMSPYRAKQIMDAVEVVFNIAHYLPEWAPVTELQCRPLVGLNRPAQAAVWFEVLIEARILYQTEQGEISNYLKPDDIYSIKPVLVKNCLRPEIIESELVYQTIQAEEVIDKFKSSLNIRLS